MCAMDEVEIIVAHQARATLRVGDVFLKVDPDEEGIDAEVEALALAPLPTPKVLWRQPPVLAISAVPGTALGRLGEPSPHPSSAWVAAGAAIRVLHDAPLPPRAGPSLDTRAEQLARSCDWLLAHDALPADLINHNRRLAEAVLQPRAPVFMHGDLQVCHIFVDGDEVTGVIDWSGAGQGDPMFDLAVLTYGHPEHLDDIAAGYGDGFDLDTVRGWWSFRCLEAIPWLVEHGYGSADEMGEAAMLRTQFQARLFG